MNVTNSTDRTDIPSYLSNPNGLNEYFTSTSKYTPACNELLNYIDRNNFNSAAEQFTFEKVSKEASIYRSK